MYSGSGPDGMMCVVCYRDCTCCNTWIYTSVDVLSPAQILVPPTTSVLQGK